MYNIVDNIHKLDCSQIEYTIQRAKDSKLDSYATINLSTLVKNVNLFKEQLPLVQPYYIMQANPHEAIVKTLAIQNVNIDCYSAAEIKEALKYFKPHQIFVANTSKTMDTIEYAYNNGVNLFQFDSENELMKSLKYATKELKCKLILRVLPPNSQECDLTAGATYEEAIRLMALVQEIKQKKQNVDIIGLGFSAGRNYTKPEHYKVAIDYCGKLAQEAKNFGFDISILSLGDGLMTENFKQHEIKITKLDGSEVERDNSTTFVQFAEQIRKSIEENRKFFGSEATYQVICQLGRFLAADCMTQAIRVFGRRILFDYKNCKLEDTKNDPVTEEELAKVRPISEVKYYVGDGVYGYFNCIAFDKVQPKLQYFRDGKPIVEKEYESHIFGPTCDSMDCIRKHLPVPLLKVSDWVVVESFGAYTNASACEFNGIPLTKIDVVYE